MITRPALKAKYHVEAVPGQGVFLLSENGNFVLEGNSINQVLPLINGARTTVDIAAALQAHLPAQEVYGILEMLRREGHIEEADPLVPEVFSAFWSEMNVDTRQIRGLFSQLTIQVIGLDGMDAIPLAEAVQAFGLRVGAPGHFVVVLASDYLSPGVAAVHRHCLHTRTPWLLVKPTGVNLWLGPIIVPGKTACWRCLESRLRHNREVEAFIGRQTGNAGPFPTARARVKLIEEQARAMAALQLVRWLATGTNPQLESQILIVNTVLLTFTGHPLVKRPQCPDCGDPKVSSRSRQHVEFTERNSSHVRDGGERNEPPEVTFERFRHHISSVTGVVTGLSPSPWHGTGPLRVYVAGHNFALKNDSLYFLKDGLRTNSSGKGRTDAQARTSALCEALERYSGLFREEEERVRGSYCELADRAIHPNACMLFSERQFRERNQWLNRGTRFQIVPRPFDIKAQIEWSPVFSYTEKRTKYLPTSYLYYGYPMTDDEFYCWADSNGNAGGSTWEDACLQGFFEIVERDSVCIWWYNRLRRPRVALESFGDPYFAELHDFYASIGREFWVLDITTDTGIPAFASINRRRAGPTEDIIMGFGAHFDPQIGIGRAITEMNQFIPAVLNILPTGVTQYGFHDAEALAWWKSATLENQPYLQPLPESYDKTPQSYPAAPQLRIVDKLHRCFSIVEGLGMEVLLLDQTRVDIGLNVAKVIVPGMRHFWARFAEGRLYNVPVRMGWLDRPTPEDQLNPVCMFL